MKHGSDAGYMAGCREDCCSKAHSQTRRDWEKAVRNGHEFQVPCDRSRRKVKALACLGWSAADVAARMSPAITQQAISRILARDVIRATTAERIDRVYEVLEMEIPPDNEYTRRTRNNAARLRLQPPLAYEDIDAGVLATDEPLEDDFIDEVAIQRALHHNDFSVRLSVAEKKEVLRRWKRMGNSERSLCQLTGWKEGRYAS